MIVAERYAAVGRRLDAGVDGADPTVAAIVTNAASWQAWELVAHLERVDRSRQVAARLFRRFDALALPTVPFHPTIAAVISDPVATNRRMGSFTNFVNLLDLAAITVPSNSRSDGRYGLSFITPAFHDQMGIDVVARLLDEPAPRLAGEGILNGTAVAVFGAHLTGQPLNHELESLGARYIRDIRTAARYRLVALSTVPKKPGLLPVTALGASIAGELWKLSPASLGRFLAALPTLGTSPHSVHGTHIWPLIRPSRATMTDVVVIGLGPAGTVVARVLDRAGISVVALQPEPGRGRRSPLASPAPTLRRLADEEARLAPSPPRSADRRGGSKHLAAPQSYRLDTGAFRLSIRALATAP